MFCCSKMVSALESRFDTTVLWSQFFLLPIQAVQTSQNDTATVQRYRGVHFGNRTSKRMQFRGTVFSIQCM